jgi:UDP-N-acetylmuramoyl-tripeptide--D-alanyl-D-alanine ligase
LESTYRIAKTPANHNNDIGMPMAVLSMPEDTEVAVLEMGMNHFREIAYLSEIARPDVGVIINVGTMHIEFLGSREGIRKAKMEITEGMAPHAPLLLNGDNDLLRELDVVPAQPITYFGSDSGCQVWADKVQQGEYLTFTAHWGDVEIPVKMALEGEHFVADAMAAIAVGLKLAVPYDRIQKSLASFRNISGRQEIFQTGEYTIINDCYNAGPESMAAALGVLGNRPGRRIAVLGDMLELGDCAQAEHYKVGRIAAEKADMVFAYGPHAGRVIDGTLTGGMPESMGRAFDDRDAMTQALKRAAKPGDVLLFKGSHGMHLELVLEAFLKEEK